MNLFSLAGWTWVWETINSLLLIICDWIYICIGWFYQVFIAVAKTNLFSREVFDKITSRLYVVVAMAMLFIFAYNIILMIIDPDKKQRTGNAGKLVKDTIISFVLVILLPTIFNYMYVFQNNVIESNVIQTIILGEDLGSTSGKSTNCAKDDFDCSCDFSNLRGLTDYTQKKRNGWGTAAKYILTGGLYGFVDIYSAFHNSNDDAAIFKALGDSCELYDDLTGGQRGAYSVAPTLFSAFYRPSSFTYEECVDYLLGNDSTPVDTDEEKDVCVNYFIDINMARYTGNIGMFVGDQELIRVVSNSSKDVIEFNGFMALLAGGLAAWMFLCYAMEIGVRVAKLGVLQLISPIPVMMRIVPTKKESMFDKWLKQLINTYFDVFIRLIIIFFSLFAISLVPDVLDTLWLSLDSSSNNAFIRILAGVVVILGILKFGQDAPGLLKEFFGNLGGGGNFSIKPSDQKQLKGAVGAAGTIGNRFLNKAGNFKRIANAKDENGKPLSTGKKVWQGVKNTGSMLNPVGYAKAGYQGYNSSKDSNVLSGINDATTKNLTEGGVFYKASNWTKDAFAQGKHFFGSDYTQNSGKMAATIKIQEAIVKAENGMFDLLDKDKRVMGLNNYYDTKRNATIEKGNYALVDEIDKQRKEDLKKLKGYLMREKTTGYAAELKYGKDGPIISTAGPGATPDYSKIEADFKTSVEALQKTLVDNFSSLKDIISKSNNIEMQNAIKTKEDLINAFETNNIAILDDLKKISEKQLESNKNQQIIIQESKKSPKDK